MERKKFARNRDLPFCVKWSALPSFLLKFRVQVRLAVFSPFSGSPRTGNWTFGASPQTPLRRRFSPQRRFSCGGCFLCGRCFLVFRAGGARCCLVRGRGSRGRENAGCMGRPAFGLSPTCRACWQDGSSPRSLFHRHCCAKSSKRWSRRLPTFVAASSKSCRGNSQIEVGPGLSVMGLQDKPGCGAIVIGGSGIRFRGAVGSMFWMPGAQFIWRPY